MQLYPFQLPWATSSLTLFGLSPRGTLIGQIWPIDDPGPEDKVTLEPGGSLSGDLDLERALDGFREAQAESAIVVVWQYHVRPADGEFLPVVTGATVAPRRSRTS
jgi:hypothetical protein